MAITTGNDAISRIGTRTPRSPNSRTTLTRPRVTELVELGAGTALCIIRGPRSWGKSAVLSQWASLTSHDVLWLHLEREVNAPALFWQQLQDAFSSRSGDNQQAPQHQTPTAWAKCLAAAIADLSPFVLIVENFHWIQHSGVEDGLLLLVDFAPNLNIIVVARSPLKVESRIVSSGADVTVIGPEQLKFTDAEAAELHRGTALEEIAPALNEHLAGSPTLHQFAQNIRTSRQASGSFFRQVVCAVTTKVRREVLASGDDWREAGIDSFVAATLNLQRFDSAVASAIAVHISARSSLEIALDTTLLKLAESGVLVAHEVDGLLVYEYPKVVEAVFADILAPGVAKHRQDVLQIAAEHELARGAYLPALAHALANDDFAFAQSILLQSGVYLLFDVRNELGALLKAAPTVQIAKYPLMALALGLIYTANTQTWSKGAEYFTYVLSDTAALSNSSSPVSSFERLALNLARTLALRFTGKFKLSASTAKNCIRDLLELPLAERDQIAALESVALSQWGTSLIFSGDFGPATTALHYSVSAAQAERNHGHLLFATSLLAYRFALDGDLKTAAEHAKIAQEIIPDGPGVEPYQLTPLYLSLAMIELGGLRPDAAEQNLKRVISESSTSEFWGRLRIIEAQIELLRGNPGIAISRLELALSQRPNLPPLNPVDEVALQVLQSNLHLVAGAAPASAAILMKLSPKRVAAVVAKARQSLAMGLPSDVVEQLSAPLRNATALQRLDALVILTCARLSLEPAATLQTDLERITGSIMALENKWPLVLLPATDADRLSSASRALALPAMVAPEASVALIHRDLSMIVLTPRESSILATLALTGDRNEIAELHFVSLNTIKTQLRSLYRKLGVNNRDDALLMAHQQRLFDR